MNPNSYREEKDSERGKRGSQCSCIGWRWDTNETRLISKANVATVLSSITASTDTVKS